MFITDPGRGMMRIYVSACLMAVCLLGCGYKTYQDWFFGDPDNFTTWIVPTDGVTHSTKSITLRDDSTFTIIDFVPGIGDVVLHGTFTVTELHDVQRENPESYANLKLEEFEVEKGKYARLLLKWTSSSSYSVLSQSTKGGRLSVNQPGHLGERYYRDYQNYVLIAEHEDNWKKSGKRHDRLGLVYNSCLEGKDKTFTRVKWIKKQSSIGRF